MAAKRVAYFIVQPMRADAIYENQTFFRLCACVSVCAGRSGCAVHAPRAAEHRIFGCVIVQDIQQRENIIFISVKTVC